MHETLDFLLPVPQTLPMTSFLFSPQFRFFITSFSLLLLEFFSPTWLYYLDVFPVCVMLAALQLTRPFLRKRGPVWILCTTNEYPFFVFCVLFFMSCLLLYGFVLLYYAPPMKIQILYLYFCLPAAIPQMPR